MANDFNVTAGFQETKRFVRRNGFQGPLDPLQVLSWFIIAFLAGSFCGVLSPMLTDSYQIAFLVVYLLFLFTVLASGYDCARRDPIDPTIHKSEEELIGCPDLLKCSACSSRVNKLSRHCLICDKCVVDYDHHCKWLNNCVGQANYRPFLCLLGSAALLIAWQLTTCVILFSKYVCDDCADGVADYVASSAMNEKVYFAFVIMNITVCIPAFMLVMHLVGFHIFLNYHGLTTYNYVMQTQAQKEAKDKEKKPEKKYIEESESGSEYESEEESSEEPEVCEKHLDPQQLPNSCAKKCVEKPAAIIASEQHDEIYASGIPGVIKADGEVEKDMQVSVHVNQAMELPGVLPASPAVGETPLHIGSSSSNETTGTIGTGNGAEPPPTEEVAIPSEGVCTSSHIGRPLPSRPPTRLAPLNIG